MHNGFRNRAGQKPLCRVDLRGFTATREAISHRNGHDGSGFIAQATPYTNDSFLTFLHRWLCI
jgi:hypothetical protein